jgi:toxin HigB-1
MKLEFKSNKIKKQCEDPKEAQKIFGQQIGIKLTLRVNELRAAKNLDDIRKNKANGFHPLEGDREGEYTVTIVHPFRLVFKPVFDSQSKELSFSEMSIVKIEEVIDYHGKNKRK